ncbi:MAG: sulfite exporter TauE/SafE family protein [Candidatus Omnitrophica bacterium]|nr:sulfite exporter TauE/SafE family protein [Candidatus Omnitrophota bacterium]
MPNLTYILLGLTAGVVSGIFGIGGATLLIPGLIFLCGLTQHQAQGTTLAAMVPPIGLLAAMQYYSKGNVKIGIAVFICIGFFLGGYIGAHYAQQIPGTVLKKAFGVFLLLISLNMILMK